MSWGPTARPADPACRRNRINRPTCPTSALAIRLAGDLYPQVGINQRLPGIGGWPLAQAAIGRVAPVLWVARRVIGRRDPRALPIAAGVDHEVRRGLSGSQHVRVAQVDPGRVERHARAIGRAYYGRVGIAPRAVRAERISRPLTDRLCDQRRQRPTVPVLVRAPAEIAGIDGSVGDAF